MSVDLNPEIFDVLVLLGVTFGCIYMIALCVGHKQRWTPSHQSIVVKRLIIFYFGFGISLLFNFTKDYGFLSQRPLQLWDVSADAIKPFSAHQMIANLVDNPKKVVLITTTRYSLTQAASLTRIGQAIFPVRDSVIWVVVSVTSEDDLGVDESSYPGINKPTGNITKNHSDAFKSKWMKMHLRHVKKTLLRFGVSFVLLRSHEYLQNTFSGFRAADDEADANRGLLTGLIWAVSNFKNGILMLGHEDFTYNYRIFTQVQTTEVASSWPVGLGSGKLGFSSPIVDLKSGTLKGYHTGDAIEWDDIIMEVGAFAVNIRYIREKVVAEVLWKMTVDGSYKLFSIGIGLQSVQSLGNNSCEILVWRTRTWPHHFPKSLKMKPSYEKSNLKHLFPNVFGVRFYAIKKITNFTERKHTRYL